MSCTTENRPEVPCSLVARKRTGAEENDPASLAQRGGALPREMPGVLGEENRLNLLRSESDSHFKVTGTCTGAMVERMSSGTWQLQLHSSENPRKSSSELGDAKVS